jgi:FMN-dependent NADH-azoreductase
VSNVLLVTCSADATTENLRRGACDALHAIGQCGGGGTVRERHLYSHAIPALADNVALALMTAPKRRSAAQWKAAAFTDLLLAEARSSDVFVIVAPLRNGRLPIELKEWIEHVGSAAELATNLTPNHPGPGKVAIVIAETLDASDGHSRETDFSDICNELRAWLKPVGVVDVALFEADADGYPLRQAPLMLIVSRSASIH